MHDWLVQNEFWSPDQVFTFNQSSDPDRSRETEIEITSANNLELFSRTMLLDK